MKLVHIVIAIIITTHCYCQISPEIDSLEFAEITPMEFCTIYNDSIINELAVSFFGGGNHLSYEKLLTIAMVWNTPKVNSELLKLKEIDLCGLKFSVEKRDIWANLFLAIDDFWSNDILFFDKGLLCLKQKGKKAVFPYYKLKSEKPNASYFSPKLIPSLQKDNNIQRDSLIKICEKEIVVNDLFIDLNPPEIFYFNIREKDENINYISYDNRISEGQKKLIRRLKNNQHIVFEITVFYPNEANLLVTEEIGPLIYKIVD